VLDTLTLAQATTCRMDGEGNILSPKLAAQMNRRMTLGTASRHRKLAPAQLQPTQALPARGKSTRAKPPPQSQLPSTDATWGGKPKAHLPASSNKCPGCQQLAITSRSPCHAALKRSPQPAEPPLLPRLQGTPAGRRGELLTLARCSNSAGGWRKRIQSHSSGKREVSKI